MTLFNSLLILTATKHIKKHIKDETSADQQRTLINRWQQELKWTLQFQMPFIVAGVRLDEDSGGFVKYLKSHHIWDLPVIILEYCNGGDVRRLLQRPQNANGESHHRKLLLWLEKPILYMAVPTTACYKRLTFYRSSGV